VSVGEQGYLSLERSRRVELESWGRVHRWGGGSEERERKEGRRKIGRKSGLKMVCLGGVRGMGGEEMGVIALHGTGVHSFLEIQ